MYGTVLSCANWISKRRKKKQNPQLHHCQISATVQKQVVHFSMIKSASAQGKKLLLPFPFPFCPAAIGFTLIKEGITPSPEQISHKLPSHSIAAEQAFCLEMDLCFLGFFVFSAGDGLGIFPSPFWPWQCGVAEAVWHQQDSRSRGQWGGGVRAGKWMANGSRGGSLLPPARAPH